MITMGLLMEWTIGFDDQSLYARIKFLHISTGVVLALLIVPRVGWRLWSGWPPPPLRQRWLRFLACLVPGLLLAGVLVQAVTGVSARWTARAWPGQEAAALSFFGLFEIPSPLVAHHPDWNRVLETVHDTAADVS